MEDTQWAQRNVIVKPLWFSCGYLVVILPFEMACNEKML